MEGKVIAKHGKQTNQKLKPYVVLEYLMKYSDENNTKSAYDIIGYLENCGISAERRSIYRDIEDINRIMLMLQEDIACLNHDHSQFEEMYGIQLGKHINDDVCEFLVTKGGYFDFKGRSGLISLLGDVIGKSYQIVTIVKKPIYTDALNQLYTIRNYAAHSSKSSKNKAKTAFHQTQIGSAGSCLKAQQTTSEHFSWRFLP